ncbi:hypothetical protein QC761_0079210 [Podospora bellae-mahoneyi]|uniref:Uncharacterized protein n=1 Tax=Podospora bellae-mahoneyi TaxID=2093777 RepID=A0ABR0FD87_9PEZI|nr:hypothetical protein QC761_0079210 [Podospora bellae-mahoneyi]
MHNACSLLTQTGGITRISQHCAILATLYTAERPRPGCRGCDSHLLLHFAPLCRDLHSAHHARHSPCSLTPCLAVASAGIEHST